MADKVIVTTIESDVFRIDRSSEDRDRCVVSLSFEDPSKREKTTIDEQGKKILLEKSLIPQFEDRTDGGVNVRLAVDKGTHLYGCGEMTGPLLRNGIQMDLWSRDAYRYQYPQGTPATGLYQNHPWVLTLNEKGDESFGFLWDSTYKIEIDLRDDAILMRQDPKGPPAPVILILAPDPRQVVLKLYSLIGKLPMPPLWALGYHQCRFSYYSERHVLHVAQEFRRTKMPCDSIWCDIHFMDDFRIFTWNPKTFPNPKKMTDELHQMNFKCLAMSDPAPKQEVGFSIYDTGRQYSSDLPSPLLKPPPRSTSPSNSTTPDASSPTSVSALPVTPYSPSTNTKQEPNWPNFNWLAYDPDKDYGAEEDKDDEPKSKVEEGGINVFVLKKNGEEFRGDMWPGQSVWPDYTMKACREWWGRLLAEFLESSGVDTVWNDVNEPTVFNSVGWTMPVTCIHRADPELGGTSDHSRFHNLYGNMMAKATWDGLIRCRPKLRPFFLNRAGFIGSQRYGATWNGDNLAIWEHLALSIPMVLNFSLSGHPFSGPDIGGYCGAEKLNRYDDGQLVARWMGIGALLPFCRSQTEDKCDFPREPYCFPEHEVTIRAALSRRYRLLPYLYTLFYNCHTRGDLITAPLFYYDLKNLHLRNIIDAFLLGDHLLVQCDLLKERKDKKKVSSGDLQSLGDLPEGLDNGDWVPFDLDNIELEPHIPHPRLKEEVHTKEEVKAQCSKGLSVQCGQMETFIHDVDLPLLFIRRGSIIFVGPTLEYVTQKPLDPLILAICLDEHGNAEGKLYEDAGDGWEYQSGDYLLTFYSAKVLSVSDSISKVEVSISRTEGKRKRIERDIILKFYCLQSIQPEEETKNKSGVPGKEQETGGGRHVDYHKKFTLHVFHAKGGRHHETITVKLPFRIA